MSDEVIPATTSTSPADVVLLQAEPQPLEVDRQRTAVVVIDMQNGFISKGGMYDLRGLDISGGQRITEPIKRIIGAARGKGVKVIYIVTVYSPDLHEGEDQTRQTGIKEA